MIKRIWLLSLLILLLIAPVLRAQVPDPTPLPLYALPDARTVRTYTSSTMAMTSTGSYLVAANMLNNTISFANVLIPTAASFVAEVPVGPDPRSVAITPDNNKVLVVLRGTDSLVVLDFLSHEVLATVPLGGALAYHVVADRNDRALVSLQGSNEIVEVDLDTYTISRRMSVPPGPAGLAVWGEFLYITHFWSGDISLLYLPQGKVVRVVSTGEDTGISQALDIDVARGLAYLPQTRANTQARHLTFDTTVFPVVNVLDLRDLTMATRERIALSAVDRPVNMPFGVVVDRFRNWLYVANAGSDDVSVIDLDTGLARANIPVGSNPRGLLLNRDNTYLFVHNVIDGSLTIVETANLTAIDVLPISNPVVSNDIIVGAQLFHSASDPRLSEDRWISCATCHFDGQPDGRTWYGLTGDARNTPPLYNLIETAPYTWTGSWDELQDVELKIRSLQVGTGLIEDYPVSPADGPPHAGLSFDLDLLAAYLLTLAPPENPNTVAPELSERGRAVFRGAGLRGLSSWPLRDRFAAARRRHRPPQRRWQQASRMIRPRCAICG